MATIIDSIAIGNHQVRNYPHGMDQISDLNPGNIIGHHFAASAAVWRQGQFLMYTPDGVALSDGRNVCGIARFNKTTQIYSAKIDFPVIFDEAGAVAETRFTNISRLTIRSAVNQGGTAYAVTTDYTLDALTGRITHVGGGTIPIGDPVFATFTFALTAEQMMAQGTNFFGHHDDVTPYGGRAAFITGKNRILTMEYDTSRTYALSGAGSNAYVSTQAIITNDATGGVAQVGKIFQLPRADYPFMGVEVDLTIPFA